MRLDAFLSLYSREESVYVRKAIQNGTSFAISKGIPFLYEGNLPLRDTVLLSSFALSSRESSKELYISALEAALMNLEVVVYGERKGLSAVLKGVEDGKGRVHAVFSSGLSYVKEKDMETVRRVLLTGGSIISSSALSSSRQEARWLLPSLSSVSVSVVGGMAISSSHPLIAMLDEGKDIAILRSSLKSRAGRLLATEGCPVVDSFSSFASGEKCIVYKVKNGRFSFLGEQYDFLLC